METYKIENIFGNAELQSFINQYHNSSIYLTKSVISNITDSDLLNSFLNSSTFNLNNVEFFECNLDNLYLKDKRQKNRNIKFANCLISTLTVTNSECIEYRFPNSRLEFLIIKNSSFRNSNFPKQSLSYLELQNVIFENCFFHSFDFKELDFEKNNVTFFQGSTSFINSNLKNCKFKANDCLVKSNFSRANLVGTKFYSNSLTQSNFSKAKFDNTLFSNCDLSFSNFSETPVKNSKFFQCGFYKTDFINSSIINCQLKQSSLDWANWSNTKLENTSLKETYYTVTYNTIKHFKLSPIELAQLLN